MSDLISREETISYIENWKEVNKYYHPYTKNTNIPIDEVIQVIKDVPSNNQTSVIEELEKIKAEIEEMKGDGLPYNASDYLYGRYQALDIVDDILQDRIAELKGENNGNS